MVAASSWYELPAGAPASPWRGLGSGKTSLLPPNWSADGLMALVDLLMWSNVPTGAFAGVTVSIVRSPIE